MTVPESFPSQVCAGCNAAGGLHFGFQYLEPFLCTLYIGDHIFLWKEPTMYVLVFSLGHLESTPYNYHRVILFFVFLGINDTLTEYDEESLTSKQLMNCDIGSMREIILNSNLINVFKGPKTEKKLKQSILIVKS